MAQNDEGNVWDVAKALLAFVGLQVGAFAIGTIATVLIAFVIANPWVGLIALKGFLMAKARGSSTEAAMAQAGIDGLVGKDSFEKLWAILKDFFS